VDPTSGLAAHRRALAIFVAAAKNVDEAQWNAAPVSDKWSPAQVAEHLRMTYEVVGGELDGKAGLVVRTSWWIRPLLRFQFLRKILADGAVPAGAKAPRELRPGAGPFRRDQTLAALGEGAAAFETTLTRRWNDPAAGATHHVFGRLTASQMLRFATVHLEHHARQLPGSDA
jgi:hypothetical protein